MLTASCVHFDEAIVVASPFRHVTIDNFIDEDIASSLLQWFDEDAHWNAKAIPGLGTLSSVNLHTSELGCQLDFLTGEPFLSHVRQRMSELFETKLEGFVDLTAHRMTQSQQIGLHNDVSTLPPAFRFTHRLVLYLNHQYSEECGGALRLTNAPSPSRSSPAQKRILPLHRSAFGFEISESSYHAIETVRQGTRYNLSFTFYPGTGAANIV